MCWSSPPAGPTRWRASWRPASRRSKCWSAAAEQASAAAQQPPLPQPITTSTAPSPAGQPAGRRMNPQAAQNYLRTRVMTATPEQLQMMLYDGAIRFAEQAKAALVAEDYEKSYQAIARVQKIITELSCGLKHDVLPELCEKL